MKLYRIGAVLACLLAPSVLLASEVSLRVTPCRLYDSRHIGGLNAGSEISSGTIETRGAVVEDVAFSSGGVDYNDQGGEAGCAVTSIAAGAVLNVIVFSPDSGGWARLWAFGQDEPLSTSINAFSGAANESTGLMVELGGDGKISLNASISAAHYIVDLAGSVQPGVTGIAWGEVTDKNLALPSPPNSAAFDLTLDTGVHVVCTQPYADHLECDVPVGSTVRASGHVLNFSGVQYLYAHGDINVELAMVTFQGTVAQAQVNDDPVAVVWDLDGEDLHTVCVEPWIDPEDCGSQAINEEVCGTAHVDDFDGGPFPAGPHLYVHTLEDCN